MHVLYALFCILIYFRCEIRLISNMSFFIAQQVDFRDKLYLAPLTTVSLFAFHNGHAMVYRYCYCCSFTEACWSMSGPILKVLRMKLQDEAFRRRKRLYLLISPLCFSCLRPKHSLKGTVIMSIYVDACNKILSRGEKRMRPRIE